MEREFRFRAWHNETEQMLFVGDSFGTKHPLDCVNYALQGQDVVLMQYVGLKDKNGKEIYEGDLLRYPGDPENFTAYEVFFHDGDANSDFNIGYSCGRTHFQGSICGGPIPSFKPKSTCQMVIIGNIYSNPELINKATS